MPSTPSIASRIDSLSVTSPSNSFTPRLCRSLPFLGLRTDALTSSPAARNCRANALPRKPVAPVRKYFIIIFLKLDLIASVAGKSDCVYEILFALCYRHSGVICFREDFNHALTETIQYKLPIHPDWGIV